MRRAEAKAANRRALLDAAAALIGRDGTGVRLEVIADAAGLTTGAIYSIFGSKNDLLVAVLTDQIARVDLAIERYGPALSLAAAIDTYVRTWIGTYRDYPKTQVAFELHLVLSAMDDEEIRQQLAAALDAEIGQLARLLEDRVIDPTRPAARTTPRQAMAIATAMKAVLTGFGLREPFTATVPDLAELARQSCLALTGLAR